VGVLEGGALTPGARVTLVAGWAEGSAEAYPVVDPLADALVIQRESLQVSWFVTRGSLDAGVTVAGAATSSANGWTVPPTAGPVHLWVVLRDSRGGSDFAEQVLQVVDGRDPVGRLR
jgi:hypothetical protein